MKLITFILAVGLLTVSLFGFAAMGAGGTGCVFSATGMNASDCPQAMLSMAMHHISAYTDFSGVTVSFATTMLLLVLLLMVVFVYIFDKHLLSFYRTPGLLRLQIRDRENSTIRGYRKIQSWLSLLLNSPTDI